MSKLIIDNNKPLQVDAQEALEARTLLGETITRQFKHAVAHRHSFRVGDFTLSELLRECFNARDDRSSHDEIKLREKYPEWACMPVSLVSFKVGILVSLIREGIVDTAHTPFIVDPTPRPEIPERERDEILNKVFEEVVTHYMSLNEERGAMLGALPEGADIMAFMNSPEFGGNRLDLYSMLKEYKIEVTKKIKKHAQEQALNLQQDLYDKTTEGDLRNAIIEFADDFATYPYACIHGPFPIYRSETVWRNNKFTEEKKVSWVFERVSPFDLYWTEDSTNTQDGAGVFIRKRVGLDYLYDARELAKDEPDSGYIYDTINEILTDANEGLIPRNWVDYMAGNPEYRAANFSWERGASVDILIRYGRFTGYDLSEMGFKNLDEDKLYETKAIMCGGQVIHCQLNNNPSRYRRPVFTASFEKRNSSIVGVGLGQKLLSLHRAYRALNNLMMYNLGLSSEPVTEVEVTRIMQYMPEDWVNDPSITPGMVIPADSDRLGGGTKAVKFTQIPNTTDSCLRIAEHILELSHVMSNIPAALHGQPVGSGANRTVRGLLTLQGNTLKPIQSAMTNLDIDVIAPMVTLLYMLLVMYEEGFDYSGDAKIVARGAAGMVQREIDKQLASEHIQQIAQLGGLLQNMDSKVLEDAITKLFEVGGYIEPGTALFKKTIATPEQAPTATPQPPVDNLSGAV